MNKSIDYFPEDYIRICKTQSLDTINSVLYVMKTGYFTPDKCPPAAKIQLDSFFFMYVLSGSGIVEYDGTIHTASSGQCVFLDCRNPHSYKPNENYPWEVMWLSFNGISAQYYYSNFTQKKCCVFIPQNPENIKVILSKIIINNTHKTPDANIIDAKLVTDLMTCVITDHRIYEEDVINSFQHKLMSIKDYLDKNFSLSINLDDLSQKFYISKFYLTREFKKEFGKTIIHYILDKRIEYARELLKHTNKSIEEIAEICGFNDKSYFSKQFKKSENMTCLSYRKKYKNL